MYRNKGFVLLRKLLAHQINTAIDFTQLKHRTTPE